MSRLPECKCLDCGGIIDGFDQAPFPGELDNQVPEEGDITVCLYCGHIMAFAKDLTVRALTDAEMKMIAGDQRIIELRRSIYEIRQEKETASKASEELPTRH